MQAVTRSDLADSMLQPTDKDVSNNITNRESGWVEKFLTGWTKSPLPDNMVWNEELRVGSFVKVDPGQELQMCLLAASHPILTTFGLLSRLLRSGARFQLMIHHANTYRWRAEQPSLTNATIYSGHYRERALEPVQDSREFFQQWTARVADIMRRPHARAYMFEGGLLWRIALKFGPEDLVQKVLSGPSEAVGSYGIGLRDISADLIGNTYSPYELDVVLGKTTGKGELWWIPKPAIWELNHPAWMGAWNDEQELTFQNLLRNMQNGTHKAHNSGTWVHNLARIPCENSETIWTQLSHTWDRLLNTNHRHWSAQLLQTIDQILAEWRMEESTSSLQGGSVTGDGMRQVESCE